MANMYQNLHEIMERIRLLESRVAFLEARGNPAQPLLGLQSSTPRASRRRSRQRNRSKGRGKSPHSKTNTSTTSDSAPSGWKRGTPLPMDRSILVPMPVFRPQNPQPMLSATAQEFHPRQYIEGGNNPQYGGGGDGPCVFHPDFQNVVPSPGSLPYEQHPN